MAILSPRGTLRRGAGLLTLAACGFLPRAAPAQSTDSTVEVQVKAAYLYNFAKFVEWPEDRQSPPGGTFVIGVLGDSPVLPALRTLEGQKVRQRTVEVRQFPTVAAANCQILFVDASQVEAFLRQADALRGRPVLTVGETDAFLAAGGVITLVRLDGHIRYRVNARVAEAARLTISSKLLKLADRILE